MISQTDINHFLSLVRADNRGTTGWTRFRSSLRYTLDAIEEYNRDPSLINFNAIKTARQQIPPLKKTQYDTALTYLDTVLTQEQSTVSQLELVSRLADNKFRVISDLKEYRSAFGAPFKQAMETMDHRSRWLDGGSGEAKAMIEYLDGGGAARCTATGYAIPAEAVQSVQTARKQHGEKFEYISGKYFGKIQDNELDWPGGGDFDLITDLNGVLYYTTTLVEDLARYLQLLAVGGLLVFTSVEARIQAPNAVWNPKRVPDLAKWASNISGVHLDLHARGYTLFYAMTKTASKIVTPPMTLDEYKTMEGNSPTRTYTCNLNLANDPQIV
jgi:SAM-dependent methyltransferase